MSRTDLVEVEADLLHYTDQAVCLDPKGEGKEGVWIPLSLCKIEEDLDECDVGQSITIKVVEWLATQKGLV